MTETILNGLSGKTASNRSAERVRTGNRILIYGMNYAPETAGVGRYTGEIAEYLARNGSAVTVVTTPPHYPGWVVDRGYANRFSASVENGIRVLRTPLMLRRTMSGVWRLIAPLSFAISSAPVVAWQILRHRPDIVLCVEPTLLAAPVARLFAKLIGARSVLHVQDLEVDAAFAVGHLRGSKWLQSLAFGFERFALRGFDGIITISRRMAGRLATKGIDADRISVVRNWVDLDHIHPLEQESPLRAELGYRQDDFIVLYSGAIGPKQGIPVLLDAAARLRDCPRIRFVVAGDGPEKSELMARYGTLPNLRFLPFQPYARLNALLNMADLHALPQANGTADLVLPSKLGGMLASGKPLIVTADEGSELMEFLDGCAVVTPTGDVARLAAEIEAAARRPRPQRDGRAQLLDQLGKSAGLATFAGLLRPTRTVGT